MTVTAAVGAVQKRSAVTGKLGVASVVRSAALRISVQEKPLLAAAPGAEDEIVDPVTEETVAAVTTAGAVAVGEGAGTEPPASTNTTVTMSTTTKMSTVSHQRHERIVVAKRIVAGETQSGGKRDGA